MRRAKQLLSLTEPDVLKDLLLTANEVVQRRKKALAHLRFARPTKHGWSFFKKKKLQCELLEEITQRVGDLHPHYEKGKIAHILSELVNLTKKDRISLQTLL